MTVVAGFQHMEVPVLFGDFLLSSSGMPSGVRRKLFRLSPNFVVGWTGARLTAEIVMSKLFNRFNEAKPTFDEVREFLITIPESSLGEMQVTITGWVIDESPHCFCWWSNYPSEVYKAKSYFFGSGAPTLEGMIENPGMITLKGLGEQRSPTDHAIYYSLTLAGRLLADELFEKNNQKNCFGVAYEILVYDGSTFSYVDDVLYVICDFSSSDLDKIVNPNNYKVKHLSEVSIIQKRNIQTGHTEVDLITPVFNFPNVNDAIEQFKKRMQREGKPKFFPVTSRYYCLAYRLRENEGSVFPGAIISLKAGPNQPITITRVNEGTERMTINLSRLHNFIVRSRAGRL